MLQSMCVLRNPSLIYAKGVLLPLGGLLAAAGVIMQHPTVATAALLVVAGWCFGRFYYFVFYAIQHDVDPQFRFAGLWAFVVYLLRRLKNGKENERQGAKAPR